MNIDSEISRLHFENFLWFLFIILSCLNIYGDYDEELFLKKHDVYYKRESHAIFTFTIMITLFIYLYFFIRNYKAYELASEREKRLYSIKLLGSAFFISGVLCLLYFQLYVKSFVGSPLI